MDSLWPVPRPFWAALLLVLACAATLSSGRSASVGAVYLDTTSSDADFGADVLDPASALAGNALNLISITLTWTATPDTYATGYRVMRSLNGGAYSEIATVTPRTNVTYVDNVGGIGAGSYGYNVVAYHAAWNSVASNSITCVQVLLVFVCT